MKFNFVKHIEKVGEQLYKVTLHNTDKIVYYETSGERIVPSNAAVISHAFINKTTIPMVDEPSDERKIACYGVSCKECALDDELQKVLIIDELDSIFHSKDREFVINFLVNKTGEKDD